MLLIHDPRCADYGSDQRPEQPARTIKTAAHLRDALPNWGWKAPADRPVPDEVLLLAHTSEHLARLDKPADFDPDTPYFPEIALHARRSVAAAIEAAIYALLNRQPAFSLMRPPGHHATSDRAMGFCYLNQVAITALAARLDPNIQRVAVWDFDAHHGNGTEEILMNREGFLYCSVHQSPCYPGTGQKNVGNSLNWPVLPHAARVTHLDALRESLDAVADFRPDLIVVSAGFDAYVGDPITEMTVEVEDFALLGRWLRETGLPAAAVLEGGYSQDLPVLVSAFLDAWAAK
jgi:acetoin utilization deacetylase AcuC-like enzyme